MNKRLKVTILAGGISQERDVSLESGRAVELALRNVGFKTDFIDVKDLGFVESLERKCVDVVFIALHGSFGEDGTVQALLEKKGIPYTGSNSEASSIALDKLASKQTFLKSGLSVPRYMVIEEGYTQFDLYRCVDIFGFPVVVKPRCEGSSIGVYIAENLDELRLAVECAMELNNYVLIEEYIKGRELTVGILKDEPLAVIEIISGSRFYDYEAKYIRNDTRYIVPAQLDAELYTKAQKVAKEAHMCLGCRDFSRIDMRMSPKGDIFVLEVNTIPGLTKRSLLPKSAYVCGIVFEKLCITIVELAYERSQSLKAIEKVS